MTNSHHSPHGIKTYKLRKETQINSTKNINKVFQWLFLCTVKEEKGFKEVNVKPTSLGGYRE